MGQQSGVDQTLDLLSCILQESKNSFTYLTLKMINQQEEWTQWYPIPNAKPDYHVERITDGMHELAIELRDTENMDHTLLMKFDNGVHSYRICDETLRTQLIITLRNKYGWSFYAEWTFFVVDKSQYLTALINASAMIRVPVGMIHYSIITQDSIIDIATESEPTIIIGNNNVDY